MPKDLVSKFAFFTLSIAFLVALLWLCLAPHFEPVVTAMALLSTIAALYIDRAVKVTESRREHLYNLAHELLSNLQVLQNPLFTEGIDSNRFRIYPRLKVACSEAIINSGIISNKIDNDLFVALFGWIEIARDFNQRLATTELAILMQCNPEDIKVWKQKLKKSLFIDNCKLGLNNVVILLMDKYSKDSGIDRDTVLFNPSPKK